MTDEQIDEAIETLARACNVEKRAAVTQALRRLVNSGGGIESRVLAEREPVAHGWRCPETGSVALTAKAGTEGWERIPLFAHPTPDDASQWISVKDRLPAKGTGVLCAVEFDGPGDWRIKVGGLHDDPDFDDWHIFGASWTPSHWMPLPKPPATIDAAMQADKETK